MGGKALKHTETRRYEAEEYHALASELVEKIKSVLPNNRVSVIQAYEEKPDFGDIDIVVENTDAKATLEPLLAELGFGELVKNGPVWSLGYNDFQVDLLFQAPDDFDFAVTYFAFNDLGNLVGRIAHKIGFKFGHNGLRHVIRDGDYKVGELVITKDVSAALTFLGFDPKRYQQGFKNLEEVFEYVVNSRYFAKSAFLFENRNYRDRVRDAKRPTYTKFLKHVDNLPTDEGNYDKPAHMKRAHDTFPDFAEAYAETHRQHQQNLLVKKKFNGRIVNAITGLENKALGAFMTDFKNHVESQHGNFKEWVITSPMDTIEDTIVRFNKQ